MATKTTEAVTERGNHPIDQDIGITPVRRTALLAAIKVAKRFRPRRGAILFLTDTLCVKYGDFVQLSEASTLRFVAAHTSIPVPKVHCAFVHKGCTYILMERIKGDILTREWWASRSEESKEKIFGQLKKMVDEMRKIPAPGRGVSNVIGGPLYDSRFTGTSMAGPFETIDDFHMYMRNDIEEPPERFPEIGDMMRLQDGPWPMPVFTHGDLSYSNILVCKDEVVGIINWETAGWYPSYWEYTMACLQGNPLNMWWWGKPDRFLEPAMPQDVLMETLRLKYFGPCACFG